MSRIGSFLIEGAPWSFIGIVLIFGGVLLVVLSYAFDKDRYVGVRKRPRKLEPWHVEPSGEQPIVTTPDTKAPARHRLSTVGQETTNLAPYQAHITGARARVVTIGPEGIEDDGNHTRTPGRVRPAQEVDEQEEGGADRERREDEGGPVRDGEEGGADAGEEEPMNQDGQTWIAWFRHPRDGRFVFVDSVTGEQTPVPDPVPFVEPTTRTVPQWYYVLPTDEFVLLSLTDAALARVSVEAWETQRGTIARDLLVQGWPMIPDEVPPFESRSRVRV